LDTAPELLLQLGRSVPRCGQYFTSHGYRGHPVRRQLAGELTKAAALPLRTVALAGQEAERLHERLIRLAGAVLFRAAGANDQCIRMRIRYALQEMRGERRLAGARIRGEEDDAAAAGQCRVEVAVQVLQLSLATDER